MPSQSEMEALQAKIKNTLRLFRAYIEPEAVMTILTKDASGEHAARGHRPRRFDMMDMDAALRADFSEETNLNREAPTCSMGIARRHRDGGAVVPQSKRPRCA